MRFWDTSAIVPLLVHERGSAANARLLRRDNAVVVWAFTRTEAFSALHRKLRTRELAADAAAHGTRVLETLATHWLEVRGDLVAIRGHAERFLREHPLRAADALQLGAAWEHVGGKPKRREFVVFDGPLVDAAAAAGFSVVSSD